MILNFKSLLIILGSLLIILLVVYSYIIKRFNSFIKDHQKKMDRYIDINQNIYSKDEEDVSSDEEKDIR